MKRIRRWNKTAILPILCVLLFSQLTSGVEASLSNNMGKNELVTNLSSVKPITVEVNKEAIQFDQPPVVLNDRTMVPLRMIFEALGAVMKWTPDTQSVTATRGRTVVYLTIGSDVAYVNGVQTILDSPVVIINERTLVSARFIGEAFGSKVDWDSHTSSVIITDLGTGISPNLIPRIANTIDLANIDPGLAWGKVVTAEGQSVPGANVIVTLKGLDYQVTLTDINGVYVFNKPLRSDVNYAIIAMPPAGMDWVRSTSTYFFYTTPKLNMIQLNPVQLSGQVTNESGKPIQGVEVILTPSRVNSEVRSPLKEEDFLQGVPVYIDLDLPTSTSQHSITDENGIYRFGELDQGVSYQLSVLAPPGYLDNTSAAFVYNGYRESINDMVLMGPNVYGQVVDEYGEVIDYYLEDNESNYVVTVDISTTDGQYITSTGIVSHTGYYNFDGLTEGVSYQVQLKLDEHTSGKLYESKPITFTYTANKPLLPNLIVKALNPSKFRGKVLDMNKEGVPNLLVNIRGLTDEYINGESFHTNSNGEFISFSLVDGNEYMLDINVNQKGKVITHKGTQYCKPSSVKFTVADLSIPTIELEKVQFMGKIIDGNGNAVKGMTILMTRSNQSIVNSLSTTSDNDGSFPICGLIADERYSMSVMKFSLASELDKRILTSKPYEFVYDEAMTTFPDYKVIYTDK